MSLNSANTCKYDVSLLCVLSILAGNQCMWKVSTLEMGSNADGGSFWWRDGKVGTIVTYLTSAWNCTNLENGCILMLLSYFINCSCRFLTNQLLSRIKCYIIHKCFSKGYPPTTHEKPSVHPTGNGCGEDPEGCTMARRVLMMTYPTIKGVSGSVQFEQELTLWYLFFFLRLWFSWIIIHWLIWSVFLLLFV